jgi:tetratricopeptide (TPR) repeat protein
MSLLLFIFLIIFNATVSAQRITQIPLKKPANLKDKILRSEKTEDVSLTLPRRLYHGMVSHYNYFYNAQTKLDGVIQKAQLAQQDDFTKLLPFYNYSISNTSSDSIELDSVMMKATAGIVLHDLRNSYTDDLLLLIGKCYYYWDKPDSAYRIFQYINYNFYPNKKDELRITIGSGADAKDGKITVGTLEKKGIITKTFSRPPARNDALLWMARIYAEQDMHDEASSLIYLLKKDPNFPKRLHPELDEIMSSGFYYLEQWDSTAFYLEKSLKKGGTPAEIARKEFLLGQIYTITNQKDKASSFYKRAKTHTNDPVMLIHARINDALLANNSGSNSNEALNELLKLANKERFDGYEDLLFYAASDVALQKKDTPLAFSLLQKSIRYSRINPESKVRNKAFSKLGNLALSMKDYRLASSSFDSINLQDPVLVAEAAGIEEAKKFLNELVQQMDIVRKEDSLQKIASMPEDDRTVYLKSLLKRLRKEKGIKEEAANPATGGFNTGITANNQPTDLFAINNTGGWYFNVNNQRTKGPSEFKNKWGTRPNQDNWRRQAAIDATILITNQGMPGNPTGDGDIDRPQISTDGSLQNTGGEQELTLESLLYNLPMDEEKIAASNQNIFDALLKEGNILKNQLEDYENAARIFEEILTRFPEKDSGTILLKELHYCLLKTGDLQKSAYYEQLIRTRQSNPLNKNNPSEISNEKAAVSAYEQIYRWYLEGDFDKARANKIKADSLYGNYFWTPQLMYIEAVYFAHLKDDSTALKLLNELLGRYGNNQLAEKAVVLQDVIQRRKEIEQTLRESKIVRKEDPRPSTPIANNQSNNVSVSSQNTPETKITQPAVNDKKPDKEVITQPAADSTKNPVMITQVVTEPIKTVANNTDTVKINPEKIKVTDSCVLAIALINVYPVYKNECFNTLETFFRTNTLSGKSGIVPSLVDGSGNYGIISLNLSYSSSECEKVKQELKTILPKQLYFMPADKYKILTLPLAELDQIKNADNLESFMKLITPWIKD